MILPKRHRPAAVLLLSLLLMAAITASTIAVSTIISNSGRQSKTINDFILASLQADSGLERALGVIKVGRSAQTITGTKNAASSPDPGGSDPRYGVDVQPSTAGSLKVPLLGKNQNLVFDLLPDGSGTLAQFILISGTTSGSGAIEASWLVIDRNGNTELSGRKFLGRTELQTPAYIDLNNVRTASSNVPATCASCPAFGYRLRLRALNASVSNIVIGSSTDGINPNGSIQSRMLIASTGKVGVTQSQKTASVLWQLPASPLFNFVLFTENDIAPSS